MTIDFIGVEAFLLLTGVNVLDGETYGARDDLHIDPMKHEMSPGIWTVAKVSSKETGEFVVYVVEVGENETNP